MNLGDGVLSDGGELQGEAYFGHRDSEQVQKTLVAYQVSARRHKNARPCVAPDVILFNPLLR